MPTALEAIQADQVALPPEVRDRWEERQLATIWNTVARGLSIPEFEMFLSLAARYELDPLLNEIWGAKAPGKDGQPGKVLIMVGRDGLLRNARRDPHYRGFDGDVVYEQDVFVVKRSAAGREIIHEWDIHDRGKMLGAWAQVYVEGKHDTFVWCPVEDYRPKNPHHRSSWATNPHAMMAKCPISLALRLAFNLSGVVGEEEVAQQFEAPRAETREATADVVASAPEDLRERLRAAWEEAQALGRSISATAVRMAVVGQSEKRALEWIEQLERENVAVRDEAEPVEAEVVSEGTEAEGPTEAKAEDPDGEGLQRRLSDLYDRRESTADEAQARLLDEEIEYIEGELRRAGGSVPGQEALL